MSDIGSTTLVCNFGANEQFRPIASFAPRSEAELLQIMCDHRGRRFRAIGRLHAWSAAPVCEDILINLRHLDCVEIHPEASSPWAEVGGGCQIKRLLQELQSHGEFTVPSLGLITEQTLAGASATGTHGSGRHSLSHYAQAIRIALFDPETGAPMIRVIDQGPELQAARCALGCLGIVTSLRIAIRKQYLVEEHFCRYETLEDVLEQERDYDLQQFFLIPWRWDYFAQHRREVSGPRSWSAALYRIYWMLCMDIGLHLIIWLLARWLPTSCTRFFFKYVIAWLVPQRWRVADRSDRQLTMEHEWFRHIEIEVFVTRSQLSEALRYVIWLLKYSAGDAAEVEQPVRDRLQASQIWDLVEQIRGGYVHHYPICIRKVLPDDTLISMASGGQEPYYAISFIHYAHPERRAGFRRFAEVLARSMATLFDARPHWGKYCPLPPEELNRIYPGLAEFADICAQAGSTRIFANDWLTGVLAAAKPVDR